MKLYILVGVAGSGKSTYAINMMKRHEGEGMLLSSDSYREKMFGSLSKGNNKDSNVNIFEELNKDLMSIIKEDKVEYIIYDATNLSRKRRRSLYVNAKIWSKGSIDVEIAYFSKPFSLVASQNDRRTGDAHVPFDVVLRMYCTQQVPRVGVDCDSYKIIGNPMFSKGFNGEAAKANIKHLPMFTWESSRKLMLEELLDIDSSHDCAPHHLESINEHIEMCIVNAAKHKSSDLLDIALFHDLGKSVTKTFYTKDGVEKAHYLGHANVSANYMLNYFYHLNKGQSLTDLQADMVEVVNQHMNAHQGITQKNINKNKLNSNIIKLLEDFRVIDSISRIRGDEGIGV